MADIETQTTNEGEYPETDLVYGSPKPEPCRVTDLLALSHVPRWAIVPHSRQQSVGDHTFRVLVIATELADRLGYQMNRGMLIRILHHDADESRTGDIPTPAKADGSELRMGDNCPWMDKWSQAAETDPRGLAMIDLADKIEALTFIGKWGVGPHALRARTYMQRKIWGVCPKEWQNEVDRLIVDIEIDRGR